MNNRKAFTIVELLTSVTIIALLLGILLPSISMIRTKAKETAQKAQFTTIDMALEAFKQDYGDYPPSDRQDGAPTGFLYCGAQKLTEALLGWDLAGFHPKTNWRHDGYSGTVIPIGERYTYDPCRADGTRTLTERKGPYLEVAKTSVFRLGTSNPTANDGLYNPATTPNFAFFDSTVPNYVICDVFGVKKLTIPKSGNQTVTTTAGTPILYYKADTSSKMLSCLPLDAPKSMYKYTDNQALINLGVLPNASRPHKLASNSGRYFCDPEYKIPDLKVPALQTGERWPNRPDTYILISAGADHEFGTNDDILNF
jgi:type II secretory pathway pseudopilin PulG